VTAAQLRQFGYRVRDARDSEWMKAVPEQADYVAPRFLYGPYLPGIGKLPSDRF